MKKKCGTVRIEQEAINEVKAIIIGTGKSIGSYFADAAKVQTKKDKTKSKNESLD